MIQSFADKRTVAIFREERTRGVDDGLARAAKRKLDLLHAAVRIEDLVSPPGNRLERLKGDRSGQWSVRVNDRWRLCFRWDGRDAHDVEFVDHHRGDRMSIAMDEVLTGRVDLRDVTEAGRARPVPVTPGEILIEEFMRPLGLSARRLAHDLGVPVNRVSQIVKGQRAITAATSLRLARYFGTTPELWLNLQSHHELRRAVEAEGDIVRREVRPRARDATAA